MAGRLAIRREEKVVLAQQEDRLELAKSDYFIVSVKPFGILLDNLTTQEQVLLRSNLALVEKFSRKMAANMLKGIIKYGQQETMREEDWEREFLDDFVDSVNYLLLWRQ